MSDSSSKRKAAGADWLPLARHAGGADEIPKGEAFRPEWMDFQLYYPMPAEEVRACTGYELVTAIHGVFAAVVPAMNACMQVPLGMAGG